MSYAKDRAAALSKALTALSPELVASPPPSTSTSTSNLTTTSGATPSPNPTNDRLSQLRSCLAKLDPQGKHPPTADKLLSLVESTFEQLQGAASTSTSAQTESVEQVVLAQMTISAYGIVIGRLVEEAEALRLEDEYWSKVENERWSTGMYLVQTAPSRTLSMVSVSLTRLRALTTSSLHSDTESQSLLSLATYRRAFPSTLLLTTAFPHLSTDKESEQLAGLSEDSSSVKLAGKAKNLIFLTLSPLMLTRQEVSIVRGTIRATRDDLAEKIGTLTLSKSTDGGLGGLLATKSKKRKAGLQPLSNLSSSTWDTLRLLDRVLTNDSPTMLETAPSVPADLAMSIDYLLRRTLPSHTATFTKTLKDVSRPGFFTRSWPYLVSIPLAAIILGRTIYNSRDTLKRWVVTAKETVRGFLVDWVVEPVRKILETVRHGDDGAMALMGKESLKSDLNSLERMVVDFGRDEYKLSDQELRELAEKVRVGDLTAVLRAWEQDIKPLLQSPIRSAVTGSLVRTLLIQVQKVKVDVALAMDGIEKMLRSQQLTFGFVGVAPSLLVLFGASTWIRGMLRRDGGKKSAREVRRRNWATMRHLDSILSPRLKSRDDQQPAKTQGYLLLELQSFRSYAHSRYFPTTDTQLIGSFLEDVRELEDSGTEADVAERRVLLERLWRWSDALGWSSII